MHSSESENMVDCWSHMNGTFRLCFASFFFCYSYRRQVFTLFVKLNTSDLIWRPELNACSTPLWKSSLPYRPVHEIKIQKSILFMHMKYFVCVCLRQHRNQFNGRNRYMEIDSQWLYLEQLPHSTATLLWLAYNSGMSAFSLCAVCDHNIWSIGREEARLGLQSIWQRVLLLVCPNSAKKKKERKLNNEFYLKWKFPNEFVMWKYLYDQLKTARLHTENDSIVIQSYAIYRLSFHV